MSESPYVIIAGPDGVTHMSAERQRAVKCHAKQFDRLNKIHREVIDDDRVTTRVVFRLALTSAENDCLSL